VEGWDEIGTIEGMMYRVYIGYGLDSVYVVLNNEKPAVECTYTHFRIIPTHAFTLLACHRSPKQLPSVPINTVRGPSPTIILPLIHYHNRIVQALISSLTTSSICSSVAGLAFAIRLSKSRMPAVVAHLSALSIALTKMRSCFCLWLSCFACMLPASPP
jgi:hypothetical protein